MSVTVIFGGQWGDEGKGKLVDLLAQESRYVVRSQGGNNAGHTVVNDLGTFKLNLVPSGVFAPGAMSVIGNGVALNPGALLEELTMLTERGIDVSRLRISDRATIVMPYHVTLDRLEEEARGDAKVGTTLKGIGPTYEDKVGRYAVHAGDLLDRDTLDAKLRSTLPRHNAVLTRLYGSAPVDGEALLEQCLDWGERLRPFITDTFAILHGALDRGEPVLLEGAQGTMLDLEFGTYPYVTSSYPSAAGACLGSGIPPTAVTRSLGVFKAYTSRVGGGPFPTEQDNEIGEQIRQIGQEYGTVTRRPRRCGWFDGVAGRFSARVNGCTGFALSRLDVLDTFDTLRVCTHYRLDGERVDAFPASLADLYGCEPVYEEFDGWLAPLSHIRRFADLPPKAHRYIERIEDLLRAKCVLVGVGPARHETIVREG